VSEIVGLFNPEIIFSLMFYLAFLGVGWWAYKEFWPWLVEYKRREQELEHKIELTRLELDERQDKRWSDAMTITATHYSQVREEIVLFRSELQTFLDGFKSILDGVVRLEE